MIVADIQGEKFVLASMADAETLLKILDRAKPVRQAFVETPEFRSVLVANVYPREFSIAITSAELFDEVGYQALKDTEAKAKAARTAASEVTS